MQKQQVFYIHGGGSFSERADFLETLRTREIRNLPGTEPLKKWTGTFVEDLGEGYEVFTPSMPNSDNARYDEWQIWFERHFEHLHDEVILVGWSLGGMFLAKYLLENELPFSVKALFLIAAPSRSFPDEREDCAAFGFAPEQISELSNKAPKIYLFHSEDDPIVPYAHALEYQKALPEAELVTFSDKNHFLIEDFPELVKKVREVAG